MGTHLRALARELGLDPVVQFLGERRDVPALLAASDIAVHPSHEEGFSNSILEAMTAGLPLVVTAVGGNVEQVIENENGFLFPPRDAAALAAALEKLLADPALRRRMGEASRRRIETEFSIERTVAGTIAFYERLLNHPDAKER
jgi:glycosyltransferase involved in cell wall biosynthesis